MTTVFEQAHRITKWSTMYRQLVVICANSSNNKLQRLTKLLCHGHAHYEMELIHIQIMMRDQGSHEIALEKKNKKD